MLQAERSVEMWIQSIRQGRPKSLLYTGKVMRFAVRPGDDRKFIVKKIYWDLRSVEIEDPDTGRCRVVGWDSVEFRDK